MARQTVVLGAGMVGVSIAWHLRQRGHEVTVVDRLQPGRETSFGNAGIIQREAVRPCGGPFSLLRLELIVVLENVLALSNVAVTKAVCIHTCSNAWDM